MPHDELRETIIRPGAHSGMHAIGSPKVATVGASAGRRRPGTRLAGALFLAVLLALCAGTAGAETPTEVDLASGFTMQVLQFPARHERLLIWIPSKYGIRDGNIPFAQSVQRQGIDYWLVDLHGSYMAPTGRYAYAEFEPGHIKELIDYAVRQGWKDIVLGGESRGATLAMQAARIWQLENPGGKALKGMLFYHPYLIDGSTPIGQTARFLPIARATNLPIYIFQPQLNTKFLHSQALMDQLQSGGAAVYFHFLDGVRGGFHLRDADSLTARESIERDLVGERVRKAFGLLSRLPTPPTAAMEPGMPIAEHTGQVSDDNTLVPIGRGPTPPLSLRDDQGRRIDLGDLDGQVVLVNFWASWCGPCVREIASLTRLNERYRDKPFRILAVNIGESAEHVATFFDDRGITPSFDLLFDRDSEAAKAWRVYAVPSTYLLDKEHRIRYGYRGALKWDKTSVVEIIDDLLSRPRDAARAHTARRQPGERAAE